MKLWQKDLKLDKDIETYTVGDDYMLDLRLVRYDVIGSIAHGKMLVKIGILKKKEFKQIEKELLNILKLHKEKKFVITPEQEDMHTAVENHLTERLGELGKKIHTARSRNDQVLAAVRLYSREQLKLVESFTIQLIKTLTILSKRYKNIPLAGRTHFQKAMPYSVGLYFEAFKESLEDDLELLKTAYKLNNQCPLGSGAGYGVPLKINRKYTAKLLGFDKVQNNTLYVQNSRGKIELAILSALNQIMLDLSKLANDLIIFSTPEFGYFSLPDEFTTGSSIMPQKKNPDILELVRAKSAVMSSYVSQVNNIISCLPSGYNRDLQLIKKPLIEGFELALSTFKVMTKVVSGLKVNKENCSNSCTKEIYATHRVYELVKKGKSFRDAYNKVKERLQ